jgi:hypothetical protein
MKEEIQKELVLLIADINVVCNQTLMIEPKELRHLFKQSFMRIKGEADKMYKLLERTSELNLQVIEDITGEIEDKKAEIRKSIKLVAD